MSNKILLDYVFPVTPIAPTPQASTSFLKQVCVVAKPKTGQAGNVGTTFECTSMTQVAARTDNTNAQQLFNAGMSKVFILLANDLLLEEFLDSQLSNFYTLLISDDFDDDDVEANLATGTITITSYANLVSGTDDAITIDGVVFTAQAGAATLGTTTFQAATSNNATAASLAAQINAHTVTAAKVTATVLGAIVTLTAVGDGSSGNALTLTYTDNDTNVGATVSGATLTGGDGFYVGQFKGVIGISSDDVTALADYAATQNWVGFFGNSTNKAKNMFYAFGSLLSNFSNWLNQQYIPMPFNDDIDDLGEANSMFDDKISFVLNDAEFGNRLALFATGGKAIVAPYIVKNLMVDLQSRALQWISGNQPQYTKKEAALLETALQEDVVNSYITRLWIEAGTVEIELLDDNFVASGAINISEPKALWRVFSELRQTL